MLLARQHGSALALAAGSVLSSVGWVSRQQRAPQSLKQIPTGAALITCTRASIAPQACWPCCLHLLQANRFSELLALLVACLLSCLQCHEVGRHLSGLRSSCWHSAALRVCRWARCNQALPLSYLHALGLPLPETQLAVWEPRLQWEELQVGPR